MPDPEQKALVLFVHGFVSNADCWKDLINTLSQDHRVRASFDLAVLPSYKASLLNFNPLRRIPEVNSIAAKLAAKLEGADCRDYKDVTLVGHSQGGLVIQQYLVDKLNGHGADLARIRQVILIATPSLGSQFFVTLRRLLLLFFQNPQESGLRVLNREMTQLLRKMSARVLQATVRSHNQWPVRIQSFYGLGDAVVMQASAESVFENVAPLEGDHSSIIRPRGPADENYKAFVDSLLTPAGHRNFWDIERYTTLIEVWPTPPTKQKVFTQKLTKLITYDNVARIAKSVTFSSRNICERSFVLDYLTHNIDGWVAAPDNAPSQPNEWSEKEKARYHETGRDFTFRFDPECKKQEPYSVEVTVYGGFNEGGRSVDFNLGGEFYCREYCLTLDLTKYLDARWWVEEPKLTIRSFDEKEEEYSSAVTVETARRLEGQWIWEITDIQNKVGVPKNRWNVVVHVSWNLRAPVSLENP